IRLEKIKVSSIEFSGETPLVNYRGKALPLCFMDYQLGLSDKEAKDYFKEFDNDHSLNVILAEYEGQLKGLLVKEIVDISNNDNEINSDTVDRAGILGTLFNNGVTVSLLDFQYFMKKKEESDSCSPVARISA
ncbi:MAG: hypothetical protein HOM21_11380, partial [Halobacteriovoraceae bacterium]|nr:hypothetical protein [Halobacteriovoraceae bacterium]